MQHPRTIQLIMDSLRYWVTDMHVDGFRFDLAPVLARELHDVDKLSAFFDIIHQDPTLANVKLIAEPWDVGPGGYQVGNFPIRWAEWNGRYRDAIRHYWRGDRSQVPDLASRLAGSSDIYEPSGRGSYASVNFITAHDGYTLHDLVSYEQKHNEANGEENRDGHDDNVSRNWGVEVRQTTSHPRPPLPNHARLHRHARVFAGRSDALARRRDRAYAKREQQRLRAGQRVSWVHWDLDDRRKQLLDSLAGVSISVTPTRCCGGGISSAANRRSKVGPRICHGFTRAGAR
jgi:glycogen operon protein